jgi:hypothetical protein
MRANLNRRDWLVCLVQWIAALACVAGGFSDVRGVVVDGANRPLADAPVFLEESLGGPLRAGRTDSEGGFAFSQIPPGRVGVFAVAPGHAFAGETVEIAVNDDAASVHIKLAPAVTVHGAVADFTGAPLAGATISRVAIEGQRKVSIPLAKLAPHGYGPPVSGDNGAFVLENMPGDAPLILKATHPEYAQEIAAGRAGGGAITFQMQAGVLLRGKVLSRDKKLPVASAGILITSNEPPHDTTVAMTNNAGEFLARVKPGFYLYRASGAEMRSPGLEQLVVTGERPEQNVVLHVMGIGGVHGEVRDALTRDPVAGARLSLAVFGNPAERAVTGSSGSYRMRASEGENAIVLESAPGYTLPENSAIQVYVSEGQDVQLPVFWVRPLPEFVLIAADEAMNPVPGAIVDLVQPRQLGWWVADGEGKVRLRFASLPSDGMVVGVAESPAQTLGAAFAVKAADADTHTVQLRPMVPVSGRVVNEKGKGIEGLTVAASLAQSPTGDPLVMWRTVSRSDGTFHWPRSVTGAPLRCVASDTVGATGQSMEFTPGEAAPAEVGNVVVAGGVKGITLHGRELRWHEYPALGGVVPPRDEARAQPAVVVFVAPAEAEAAAESLAVASRMPGLDRFHWVLAVDGESDARAEGVVVVRGASPGTASTFLLDTRGRVTLETLGLPSPAVLRDMPAETP